MSIAVVLAVQVLLSIVLVVLVLFVRYKIEKYVDARLSTHEDIKLEKLARYVAARYSLPKKQEDDPAHEAFLKANLSTGLTPEGYFTVGFNIAMEQKNEMPSL